MSTLKKPLLVLAALFGLVVLITPWTTIRYRLSVEVETPEGVKNGSGVNMAGYSAEPEMFGARPFHHGVWRGEAIPVDLGARGTFYVLLTGRSATTGQPDAGYTQSQMLVQTLAPDIWQRNLSASTVFRLCFLSGSADVPHKLIPFLVRFRDEKDPKTVEAVDPATLPPVSGQALRSSACGSRPYGAACFHSTCLASRVPG